VLIDAGDRAGEWMWETLADKDAAHPELFGRLMQDIATLHGPAENTLLVSFGRAVTGKPERAQNWHSFLDSNAGGYRLSHAGIIVGQTLRSQADLPEEQCGWVLNNLSVHLSDAGDGAGALAAIREAAEIYGRLAKANPARFAVVLEHTLRNLDLIRNRHRV
jgi:hypothetical protein